MKLKHDIQYRKKRRLIRAVFFTLMFMVGYNVGTAEGASLSLYYPGIGVSFGKEQIVYEIRGQYDGVAGTAGARIYLKNDLFPKVKCFSAVGAHYVSFKGDDSSGTGYAVEFVMGLEKFISERLAIQFEIGQAYIYLKDSNYSVSEEGVAYFLGVGINFYFPE